MIDGLARRQWAAMVLFVLIALVLVLVRLLPLWPGRIVWPGPDILLCVTLVWVLRRPDQVPVLLIAAVFLIEGFITLRPLGLWAAVVVIGTEAARRREYRWREAPFLVEWLRVSTLILMMLIGNRMLEAAFFVPPEMSPRPPLGQTLLQFIATVATYPVVAMLARYLLGMRRAPHTGMDS
ncbi:MAG: rod shape-determining protein MreD [Paracoccus denitrificans]|nr:MAG: rod shape-determining protein MreD [Paracoccus denitrificans]PZO83844.1 MAG: rod shape-determining protein MreD [Paracoccus denitrificans]